MRSRISTGLRRSIGSLAVVMLCGLALTPTGTAVAQPASGTGFSLPFAGSPRYEQSAPTKTTDALLVNRQLGRQAADALAAQVGLERADALSEQQYRDLVTGGGVGGDSNAGALIEACTQILTNTEGRPLVSTVDGMTVPSVLASYGLYVNPEGELQSPANSDAPTRQVNTLLAPGGYVGTWLRNNGALRTVTALYRSAYTVEAFYGFAAQQISGAAQLVTNTKDGTSARVGMSMAPPLWIVNFTLLYVLQPSLAAAMPAYWTPIPPAVADGIESSPTGQVPYSEYESYFR